MSKLEIIETVHECVEFGPNEGRKYRRFKPTLFPDCLAKGQLTFAEWEAWEDEPDKHAAAKMSALQSAKQTMQIIANEVQ